MTRPSEYVFALISGYSSYWRRRRKLVILQAIVDDSGKGSGPVFVLAGFVLGAYKWGVFADEWKSILDISPPIKYFKMNEAWTFTGEFKRFSTLQRDERLQKLVSLIVSHRPLAIREVVYQEHFIRHFKGKIAKKMDYPYFLSVTNIIGLMIMYQLHDLWHATEPVDFVFDEQGKESDLIQKTWEFTKENLPAEFRPLIGNRPIHRDEKLFLPLQAADLFAWQSRRCYADRVAGKEYSSSTWKELSKLKHIEFEWSEEHLKDLSNMVRTSGAIFEYDLKNKPKALKAYNQILRERFSKT